MSENRPIKWFIIAVLVPVIILLSLLIKPLQTTFLGEDIQLATVPIDPRDLFYGDYVILNLEIETVPAQLLDEELYEQISDSNYYGDMIPVFVSLEKNDENLYEVKNVSKEKPNDLYIKGKMYPYIHENHPWDEESSIDDEYVMIDYGIDRFYVEEGTGLELEKLSQKGEIVVFAKVYNGYVILENITQR